MFARNDPRRLARDHARVIHVHAKFYELEADGRTHRCRITSCSTFSRDGNTRGSCRAEGGAAWATWRTRRLRNGSSSPAAVSRAARAGTCRLGKVTGPRSATLRAERDRHAHVGPWPRTRRHTVSAASARSHLAPQAGAAAHRRPLIPEETIPDAVVAAAAAAVRDAGLESRISC